MPKIHYTTAKTTSDLRKILELQKKNLEMSITKEELHQEGFVTVHHSLELLEEMNQPFPHIIAKEEDELIGYTLVMLKSMKERIPVLIPMIQRINALAFEGEALNEAAYFIMGQVCIKKGYRGKGIFKGLYDHMKKVLFPHFKYVITGVSDRNQRSMRAHQKQGFEILHTYTSKEGEEWAILIWNLTLDKP